MYIMINKKTKKIICKGETFDEIAEKVYISPKTLKEHYNDRYNEKRFIQCEWRIIDDTDR